MEAINNLNGNVISAIFGILTILATVIIYYLQKRKKCLSYEVISDTSIVTVTEIMKDNIKILYKNEEVKNVRLIELKIINSGNQAITISDFTTPLKISFSNTAKILSCDIEQFLPNDLNPIYSSTSNDVFIEPLLLNPKDYFILKTLISDPQISVFKISARIKDVEAIKKIEETSPVSLWSLFAISIIVIIFVFTAVDFFKGQSIENVLLQLLAFGVIFMIIKSSFKIELHKDKK